MQQPLDIPCHQCGLPMARVEEVKGTDDGPPFDLYRCYAPDCGRKVVVLFEPVAGLTDDQATFVQREIARRGAFFPSDFTGSGRVGRLR